MSLSRLKSAASYVRRRTKLRPRIGIVLGSGMSGAVSPTGAMEIPFGRIPHFPASGVRGHAGILSIGRLSRRPVAVMKGRVHYYEGHSPDRVVFPVRLLAMLGVRTLILTNAVGGIRRAFRPGDLMVIRDHINLMGVNPLRGPNLDALGPRFPDLSSLYDPGLRRAARRSGVRVTEGVYAAVSGPNYETPAEVRAIGRLGADAVGMSVVPEALAAAHMGMKLVGVSCITNRAAGISGRPLSHQEVIETTARALQKLRRLLTHLVASL